uniref:CCHC-type domain-containing protein n=1 Tax=Tanacetum cinerariifolium TaxID=118510 RepID=A0A6L2N587_TANCI|nr:hypothetical protein [Tanacetum cinerariifolium]
MKLFARVGLFDWILLLKGYYSSHEYLNDLEEEYQARALLSNSKRFFKKGTQRFSSAKATDQTECHKCGKKGHFARDYWSKTPVPSYQSPFQPKLLHSSKDKPEPRRTKDFEAKYNKVKAKLAFLSSSASALSSSLGKNKAIKKEFSLANKVPTMVNWSRFLFKSEQFPTQKKKILEIDQLIKDTSSSGPKDLVFIKSLENNSKMSISGSNKPKLSGAEDFTLSNHDTVCSTPLPPLEKLTGGEPVFRPKTIKLILKSKSTFKAKTLKGIIINEPYLAPIRGNKSSLASKTNSAHAARINHLTSEIKTLNRIISLRRGIKPRNLQDITKNYKTYGSNVHTTCDYNDIEWFRKREAL